MTDTTKFKTKSISWFNPIHQTTMDSKIIIQNENGPCSLIAIVNTLILNYQLQFNYQTLTGYKMEMENRISEIESLIKLIENNSIVKVSDILDNLALILINNNNNNINIDEILNLLPKLINGLNINPNFLSGTIETYSNLNLNFSIKEIFNNLLPFEDQQENLETTPESELFKAFSINIYHGWLIDPLIDLKEYKIINYLQSFDNCQNFLIFTNDLLNNNQSNLNEVQKQLLFDYSNDVKNWLKKSSNQLTSTGIENLNNIVESNKFSIFFRNDHFSTMFNRIIFDKNGNKKNELYCLVTDEGFKNYKKIIWQELNINGKDELFFDKNFIPIDLDNIDNDDDDEDDDFKLAKRLQLKEDSLIASKLQKSYKKSVKKEQISSSPINSPPTSPIVNTSGKNPVKKSSQVHNKQSKGKDCIIV